MPIASMRLRHRREALPMVMRKPAVADTPASGRQEIAERHLSSAPPLNLGRPSQRQCPAQRTASARSSLLTNHEGRQVDTRRAHQRRPGVALERSRRGAPRWAASIGLPLNRFNFHQRREKIARNRNDGGGDAPASPAQR